MFEFPFNETTSSLSGFSINIEIAFAVSIAEPPPTAKITSGLNHLLLLYPSNTLVTVGFGLTSSYNSYFIFPSSSIEETFSVTPASTKDLSDTKNTLL